MERTLQSRLQVLIRPLCLYPDKYWAVLTRFVVQEAEAKASSADERERSINERLSQTLSRINVLEAQVKFNSLL